jgi:hypothetical protein
VIKSEDGEMQAGVDESESPRAIIGGDEIAGAARTFAETI